MFFTQCKCYITILKAMCTTLCIIKNYIQQMFMLYLTDTSQNCVIFLMIFGLVVVPSHLI